MNIRIQQKIEVEVGGTAVKDQNHQNVQFNLPVSCPTYHLFISCMIGLPLSDSNSGCEYGKGMVSICESIGT